MFLLLNFLFLDYCYTDLKLIPMIIKTILNVYSGCFSTIYLLLNFLFLDYCYIDLKLIPMIIQTILNVYSRCFSTIYLLSNFLFLDYCYIDLKFFPVILKNNFKCSCTGARYYCLQRSTIHGEIAYQ